MKKLVILATHPIQYQAPWFAYIAAQNQIDLTVYFLWDREQSDNIDRGFGRTVQWDTPLTEGYSWKYIKNTSRNPGTHHFMGLRNPTLISELKVDNPDTILCLGYRYYSFLTLILSPCKEKPPLLFRGDSHLKCKDRWPKQFIKKAALSILYNRFQAILFTGDANHTYFKHFNVPESKLFFSPHVVDPNLFHRNSASIKKSGTLKIFFSGKLDDNKQVRLLLKTFSTLKLPDSELHIIGDGLHANIVKEAAATYSNVYFHGFVNQTKLADLYIQGSVLVLPSLTETWGLVVQEAAMLGIPSLVSANTGVADDLVIHGETGYVFDATHPESLGLALSALSENRSTLPELGKNARKRVQKYNYATATAGLMEALERAWRNSAC